MPRRTQKCNGIRSFPVKGDMSAKTVDLKYLGFSVLSCALCAILAFNAAGWCYCSLLLIFGSLLVIASSSGGIFLTPPKAHTILILLAVCILVFQAGAIRKSMPLDPGLPRDRICSIEGRVVYDSSFTQGGNHMMKISLKSCSAANGDKCSARGVLSVLGRESQIISSGMEITLRGRFEDDLFVYDDLQVTGRSFFNTFRERVIDSLQRRILSDNDEEPGLLSCQLLLGRADEGTLRVAQKARLSGCSHVLALSGMHLGILITICTAIFGKGKAGKAVSLVAVALFVMTAGPRPSLVRAALGCCLFFVGIRERVFLVMIIQLLVFSQSFSEIGCCYGYVAVFAIVHLSPYIDAVLFQYIGRLSKLLSATLAALLLTAPIQILSNGFWCPSAILASPMAGLLAALSMVLGLLELSLGKTAFLVKLNGLVYSLMENLFDTFGRWPKASWVGYAVFVVLILLFLSANRIDRRIVIRRRLQ